MIRPNILSRERWANIALCVLLVLLALLILSVEDDVEYKIETVAFFALIGGIIIEYRDSRKLAMYLGAFTASFLSILASYIRPLPYIWLVNIMLGYVCAYVIWILLTAHGHIVAERPLVWKLYIPMLACATALPIMEIPGIEPVRAAAAVIILAASFIWISFLDWELLRFPPE